MRKLGWHSDEQREETKVRNYNEVSLPINTMLSNVAILATFVVVTSG